MSSDITPEQQEKIFRDIFNVFDKDGNGTICASELGDAIRKANPDKSESDVKQQVEEILKALDRNSDGVISFDEFVKALKSDQVI